ncbi:MAG: tRNA1(Val) (adenine(37)-N6)-methyltransferase [Ruminiclostridium sp.]
METEIFDLFGYNISVSADHRFGTDALLLARFAAPAKNQRVCDLCSGCGIIPMLFQAWGNPPKETYAVEIQREAHDLLKMTVAENKLEGKVIPVFADLTKDEELFAVPREKMDMVTVNPPYFKVKSGLERLSPAQAAARHELFCNLEQVIRAAALLLKYGGSLKICHIPERLTDIFCLMRKYGIEPKVLQFAHNRAEEKPYLLLVSGRKGGKAGLSVEKPVIVDEVNRELFGK